MTQYSQIHSLATAKLDWTEGGDPISATYGDVYFSKQSGLEESEYVFFELNDLPNRWESSNSFTVCELGFGTGLNFLLAVSKWQETSSENAWLNFVSIENEPLNIEDLKRALSKWPSLIPLTNDLVQKYPLPIPGFHRILFPNLRTSLTLCLGDAEEILPELNASVDAWFLDGFAPAKNPEMWTQSICKEIARLSNSNSTFGTFTAASVVRKGLEEVGFEVLKCEGFGTKRDSLRGRYINERAKPKHSKPWLSYENFNPIRPKTAAVIGAGIAGTSIARALSLRGVKVSVFDKEPEAANAASGNPFGLMHPYPMTARNELGVLLEKGFLFSKQALKETEFSKLTKYEVGALQIPASERLKRVFEGISDLNTIDEFLRIVDSKKASKIAGTQIDQDCFHYPTAEVISPKDICQTNLSNIEQRFNFEVETLTKAESGWIINELDETFDIVVIACSYHANKLKQTKKLFLRPVRGELVLTEANENSGKLKCIVSYDGYIIPEIDGQHVIGASYHRDDEDLDLREDVQDELISKANSWLSEIKLSTTAKKTGRASIRAATFDKLPILGPAPDFEYYKENYLEPHQRKHAAPAKYHSGLFVSIGYGSRGFISAQLCGEQLASQILEEPYALETKIISALHPGRVILRDFKTNQSAKTL